MNANAVVFTGPGIVRFCPVTCPEPGPNDAVIRTTHSWISNGTEGSYLRGERTNGDTPYQPGDPDPFPIVPGYQKIGVVESVGSLITDLSPGETVFCTVGSVKDMFFEVGGHISPSIGPRECIWKLPRGNDPLMFSGMLLTQVGYNCGSRAPIEPGQEAVVVGDGPVGQWALQTLNSRGAKTTMVGMDSHRLELAQRLTQCRTVNIQNTDWVSAVSAAIPDGVSVAVDTVGSREATEQLIPLTQRGGHIVSAGFCGTDDRVSLQELRDQEISLDSVSGITQARMDKTLELISEGVLKTVPLITHHFPAAQAVEAWELIRNRTEPVLGVILDWTD